MRKRLLPGRWHAQQAYCALIWGWALCCQVAPLHSHTWFMLQAHLSLMTETQAVEAPGQRWMHSVNMLQRSVCVWGGGGWKGGWGGITHLKGQQFQHEPL
jgi:hypothetical protein